MIDCVLIISEIDFNSYIRECKIRFNIVLIQLLLLKLSNDVASVV